MGDPNKPVPVLAGESTRSIPPASGSLANVLASGSLESLEAAVPEFHRRVLGSLGVRSSEAEAVVYAVPTPKVPKARIEAFGRGDRVVDMVTKKRGIVLQCGVRKTDEGIACHRIVSEETGDIWVRRETKLRLR